MEHRTTFRRTCDRCDATFFSPDRYAVRCPKCIKRYGRPTSQDAGPRAQAQPWDAQRRQQLSTRGHPDQRASGQAKRRPARPRIVELTDELRAAIQQACQRYSAVPNLRLRDLHRKIAHELNTTRALVSEVLHGPHRVRGELPSEIREEIIRRYTDMVYRVYRPDGGRRRLIAAQMEVAFSAVSDVVREWRAGLADDVRVLSRQQCFEIEKAYWRHLEAGQVPLSELPRVIADELGFTEWQVARRIDLLHEDTAKLASVEHPGPELAERIEAAYREYLKRREPPRDSLHITFAKTFGITPKQVYLVLLNYRNRVRARAAALQVG
ncbi:MAG: hypothetical protein ACUVTZ_12490 [Armatimonadota bacterium]